jgi:transcription elongation factor Elf1
MPKALTCPICGGEAKLYKGSLHFVSIHCDNNVCPFEIETRQQTTAEDAMNLWRLLSESVKPTAELKAVIEQREEECLYDSQD